MATVHQEVDDAMKVLLFEAMITTKGGMKHFLERIAINQSKDSPQRCDEFSTAMDYLQQDYSHKCLPLPDDVYNTLKLCFVENPSEPPYFRAYASWMIGKHYNGCLNPKSAKEAFEAAMMYCQSATDKDRNKMVAFEWDDIPGSEFFDRIDKQSRVGVDGANLAIHHPEYSGFIRNGHHDRDAMMKVLEGDRYSNDPALAEEYDQIFQSIIGSGGDLDLVMKKPPTLTTKVLDEVSAFPPVDKTFLIIKTDYEGDRLMESHLREDDLGRFELSTVAGCVIYCVVEVDLERLSNGKQKKIFRRLSPLIYCQCNDSYAKNVISSFVVACREPYKVNGLHKETHPAQRPLRVLHWSDDEDESNSAQLQIQSFMNMMGCTQVHRAPSAIVDLVYESGVFLECTRYSKVDTPLLHDRSRGKGCGNCKKLGCGSKCLCGKAYYCSKACQKAHWKAHKPEHDAIMANKKRKKTQK